MTVIKDLKQIPETLDLVVFDLETTGFSQDKDRIVEIGAIKVHDGEVTETYLQRVNPFRAIPARVSEIHGIYDKDVFDKPGIDLVLPQFMDFLGKSTLIAHNAPFDVRFVKANLLRLNMSLPFFPVIDTLALAKQVFPGLKSYSLSNLAAHFEIEVSKAHSADDDCRVTLELFKRLTR